MRILAIDPGYDRCGVAILEGDRDGTVLYSACIETSRRDTHQDRLAMLFRGLTDVVEAWHPDMLAIETLFFSVNKTSAIKVAEARGAALVLAGMRQLSVIELSPQEVKLSVTGVGNASKQQVQKMVGLILKIDISKKIDDEVDAIALGMAALRHRTVDNLSKTLAKKKEE